MAYLIDTDILVFYLRKRQHIVEKLLSIPATNLYTSSMCIGELYYGAAKSQQPTKRRAEVDALRNKMTCLAASNLEMAMFGQLKALLELQEQRLADADLIIAATAITYQLTLVTGNYKHFRRIEGLQIES
jgi:predicted nucleic acid-binding protein